MKYIILFVVIILLAVSFYISKVYHNNPEETVLNSFTESVKSPFERVEVEYINKITRRIIHEDKVFTCKMTVRNSRFIYEGQIGKGILGIYNPGEMYGADTSNRIVYRENEVKFDNALDLKRYLYQGSAVYKRVFLGNGIVLSYTSSNRGVNVVLERLYIKNEHIDKYVSCYPGNLIIAQQVVAPEPVTHQ